MQLGGNYDNCPRHCLCVSFLCLKGTTSSVETTHIGETSSFCAFFLQRQTSWRCKGSDHGYSYLLYIRENLTQLHRADCFISHEIRIPKPEPISISRREDVRILLLHIAMMISKVKPWKLAMFPWKLVMFPGSW